MSLEMLEDSQLSSTPLLHFTLPWELGSLEGPLSPSLFNLTLPSGSHNRPPSPSPSEESTFFSLIGPPHLPEVMGHDPNNIDFENSNELLASVTQIVEIGNDALLAYDGLLSNSQLQGLRRFCAPGEEGVMGKREGEDIDSDLDDETTNSKSECIEVDLLPVLQ